MIFWSLVVIMLAVAALFVLWPLGRAEAQAAADPRKDVLIAQMREVEADGDADREAERAELGRRIIALEKAQTSISGGGRSVVVASVSALVAIPALVVPLYMTLGSPADALVARDDTPLENQSLETMVVSAERHLAKNPDDVQGWEVLARVYGSQGRQTGRIKALENLVRLKPENAFWKTDLAQALAQQNGNIIPDRAVSLLDEALQLEPDNEKASFFRAAAYEQAGAGIEALAIWQRLSSVRTDDARWQQQIAERIAALSKPAPSIATQTQRALESAPAGVRDEMILGMVEGLAERLSESPDDVMGWRRLLQAYTVLGTPERARDALDAAITSQPSGSDLVAKLTALRASFDEVR
ncbi:MAG: c-type cytochrome biogenesis protein CcmI [Pseudomonadota bacterium]